jgi:hypothetical protein
MEHTSNREIQRKEFYSNVRRTVFQLSLRTVMFAILLWCVFLAGRVSTNSRLSTAERALNDERNRAAKAEADYNELAKRHETMKRQLMEELEKPPGHHWHDDGIERPIPESKLKRTLREGALGFPQE